jgi:hypothetical protein
VKNQHARVENRFTNNKNDFTNMYQLKRGEKEDEKQYNTPPIADFITRRHNSSDA